MGAPPREDWAQETQATPWVILGRSFDLSGPEFFVPRK